MPTSPDHDLESTEPGRPADSWASPDEQPMLAAARVRFTASLSTKDPGPVNPTLTDDGDDR